MGRKPVLLQPIIGKRVDEEDEVISIMRINRMICCPFRYLWRELGSKGINAFQADIPFPFSHTILPKKAEQRGGILPPSCADVQHGDGGRELHLCLPEELLQEVRQDIIRGHALFGGKMQPLLKCFYSHAVLDVAE